MANNGAPDMDEIPQDEDTIFDAYPHFDFDDGTESHRRFERLKLKPFTRGEIIHWPTLRSLGLESRAKEVIGDDSPWRRVFTQREPAHREISVEFLSTFHYNDRAEANAPEGEPQQVSFSLFGQPHRMSLARFGCLAGIYTEAETELPMYVQAIVEKPTDELSAFWPRIGDDVYTGVKLRATNLRDPLHRYLFRLIARTIAGRRSGGEWITPQNMNLLFCLLTGTPCNLAHHLAVYFFDYHSRAIRGPIVCGHTITKIAKNLGLHASIEGLRLPHVMPHPQGMDTITGMRITKIINKKRVLVNNKGEAWTGPELRPGDELLPPLLGSIVRVEQVVEDVGGGAGDVVQEEEEPRRTRRRAYNVVRVPRETQQQLDNMQGHMRWLVGAYSRMMAHMGLTYDVPPPDIAASTTAAPGGGASTSAAPGGEASTSTAPGDGAPSATPADLDFPVTPGAVAFGDANLCLP